MPKLVPTQHIIDTLEQYELHGATPDWHFILRYFIERNLLIKLADTTTDQVFIVKHELNDNFNIINGRYIEHDANGLSWMYSLSYNKPCSLPDLLKKSGISNSYLQ